MYTRIPHSIHYLFIIKILLFYLIRAQISELCEILLKFVNCHKKEEEEKEEKEKEEKEKDEKEKEMKKKEGKENNTELSTSGDIK